MLNGITKYIGNAENFSSGGHGYCKISIFDLFPVVILGHNFKHCHKNNSTEDDHAITCSRLYQPVLPKVHHKCSLPYPSSKTVTPPPPSFIPPDRADLMARCCFAYCSTPLRRAPVPLPCMIDTCLYPAKSASSKYLSNR